MTELEEEFVAAVAREDLTRLIKEYARVGYGRLHGQEDEGFDALWERAFRDAHEEKPRSVEQGLPLYAASA